MGAILILSHNETFPPKNSKIKKKKKLRLIFLMAYRGNSKQASISGKVKKKVGKKLVSELFFASAPKTNF